jgi:hypothetical protein
VPLIEVDEEAAKRLVNRILAATPQGRALTEDETAELLGYYGIRLVRRHRVTTLEEAFGAGEEFGWNVVLKAGSSLVPYLDRRPTSTWKDLVVEAGERHPLLSVVTFRHSFAHCTLV